MIYLFFVFLLSLVVYYFINFSQRNALDVYYSIKGDDLEQEDKKEDDAKTILTLEQKVIFILIAVIMFLLVMLFLAINTEQIALASIFSISISYIFVRILAKKDMHNAYKKYDFYLPIVMERLVMAVQGGNDIYSAVNIIVELSKKNGKLDPVTKLLDLVLKKNKSGLSFEDSLSLVANTVNLTSIRHGFLHLGIAQKEGGEIVGPMEELSDATQEYYQQVVEKEIAIMPVKATLPLLCAFVGLIIFFLAVPLTQIMTMDSLPQ